jgi:hypothetical protein
MCWGKVDGDMGWAYIYVDANDKSPSSIPPLLLFTLIFNGNEYHVMAVVIILQERGHRLASGDVHSCIMGSHQGTLLLQAGVLQSYMNLLLGQTCTFFFFFF